jgi:hypothetical protein
LAAAGIFSPHGASLEAVNTMTVMHAGTQDQISAAQPIHSNDGPIFIVGAPRSGTTLLQYMLRSHPRISLPTGESHFIIPLFRSAEAYGDLTHLENIRAVLAEMYRRSADFLDTDLHGMKFDIDALAQELHTQGRHSMQAIIAGLFEKNACGEGKARWGDKTPYYVLHLPKIMAWFPDAQIIHLIRDGRDVALSLFARQDDFGVYNTYFAAKYWQQYVETGMQQGAKLGPHQYLEMRYEDILLDQKSALQKICGFLSEEFSESLLEFKKSGMAGKTPLLQKPVQSDNAGKWRSQMSPMQIRVFESAAGDTLKECGYALTTPAHRLPLPVKAAMRWHNRFVDWRRHK